VSELVTVNAFDALGSNLRFGTTENGTPFVVAADFARVMDYSRTSDAAGLLDDDEKGTAIIRTPGGEQRMTVIYEDGIWELIFRSTKPEAKALKKRVKEILAEIRRTGAFLPDPHVPAQRRESDLSTPEGVLAMAEMIAANARQMIATRRAADTAQRIALDASQDARVASDTALKAGADARVANARLDAIEGNHEWLSAQAWANLHGWRQADRGTLQRLGTIAGMIGRAHGLVPGTAPHAVHGRVNTWPVRVWNEAARRYRGAA